jgi:cellulose synthase (UDP-forming)
LAQGTLQAIKKWWSDVLGTRVYFRFGEKEDRKRRLAGQFFTFITIGLGFSYLLWHFDFINWGFWYSFVFFLAELIGLILFEFFAFNAWFLRFHSPQGVPFEKPLSVDIFITVAGEPVELLKETVEAAVQIDYPDKKVYVLDDKGNIEYQRIAEKFRCGYFAREDHSDAKAGNLNYASQRTSGDLILTLDADQVPQPQIINLLIGYFKFPLIAFVQTKQDFKVPKGDPFGNADRIFYNVMQAGKDTDNAAFSCGSGVIYRRKALEEIGGFSTWNLVEDVHTSMLLHDRGWRSIYYNYPLTKGTAPTDIYGVYKQRKQWAADSLRMLFWDNFFYRKGLTFKQKLQYFNLGFVYLVAAFVMPIFFLAPILALLTNNFVLTVPVRSYVLHRFPYFIAMSVAYGIISYPTPYMKAFQMWTGLFPAFIHATWIALRSRKKKPSYQVNVKPIGKIEKKNPWLAILPQGGIILLSIFSLVYIFIIGVANWDFYLLNFVWSIWSIWTMSGICLAAIGRHRWPEEGVSEKKMVPSFFPKIKELFITVILTVSIMVFFTMADMSRVNEFLGGFRLKVLSALSFEKPVSMVTKEISRGPEVSKPYLKEKTEQPEKSAAEVIPMEKKEEVVKKEEVTKEEKVAQNEKGISGEEVPKKDEVTRKENWVVHVASVKTEEQAMVYKERLMAAGFPAYSILAKVKGGDWIRVRVGFFNGRGEAQKAGEEIEKKFIAKGPYWITKISKKEMEDLLGK